MEVEAVREELRLAVSEPVPVALGLMEAEKLPVWEELLEPVPVWLGLLLPVLLALTLPVPELLCVMLGVKEAVMEAVALMEPD